MWQRLTIISGVALIILYCNVWFLHPVTVPPQNQPTQLPQYVVQTDPPFCGPVVLDRSLPLVAFASSPKSGNTFMRHLIEEASGYTTGSIYNDIKLWNAGLHGENQLIFTIVVKTHRADSSLYLLMNPHVTQGSEPTKVLLLVRYPFDSIWSHFNFELTMSHTATAKNFTTEQFDYFGKERAMEWRNFYKYWLDLKEKYPTKIVRYEDLRADLCGEMASILDFLLPDKAPHLTSSCLEERNKTGEFRSGDRLSCAVRRNSKCITERECRSGGSIGGAIGKYTEQQAKQLCNLAGDYIKYLGYPIPSICGNITANSSENYLSSEIFNATPLFKPLEIVEKN